MLSHELQSMRKSLTKKHKAAENNLGVIGNIIEFNKATERANSQRGERGSSRTGNCYRKKLSRITRNMEGRNPFKGELHGWEIRA